MKATIGAVALVAALAGCSSGGQAEADPEVTPDDQASAATEQAAEQPTVSAQTTCDQLFVQGDPRLWSRATSLVAAQSNGESWDSYEALDVYTALDDAAASAGSDLQPFIEEMAQAINELDAVDVSAYKTAATEVSNQCAEYVALS